MRLLPDTASLLRSVTISSLATGDLPFLSSADTIILYMACMAPLPNLSVTPGEGNLAAVLYESHDNQPANQSGQSSAAVIQPAAEIELMQAPSRSNATYP